MESYSDLKKRLIEQAETIEDVRLAARDCLQAFVEHFILVTDTPKRSVHIGQLDGNGFRECRVQDLKFKRNGDLDFAIGVGFPYDAKGNETVLIVQGQLYRQPPNPPRPRILFTQGDSGLLNDLDDFAAAMNRALTQGIDNFDPK